MSEEAESLENISKKIDFISKQLLMYKKGGFAFLLAGLISLMGGVVCFGVWLRYLPIMDRYRLTTEIIAINSYLVAGVTLFSLCLVALGLYQRTRP